MPRSLAPALVIPLLAALMAGDAVGAAGSSTAPASAQSVGEVLSGLERQSAAIERQLAGLSERSRQLEAFAALRGRSYVRLARMGMLPAGAGFSALVDHAARLERLRRALERDLREAEAVARERTRLGSSLEQLATRRELLEGERSALERSHAAIRAAQDREDAFTRAFKSTFRADHTAVYGSVGVDTGPGGDADFASLKGRLPFPLAGRSEIRETRRGTFGPGLAMAAARGASVRSIHRGRVAYADAYPDLGSTAIVDHGSGYFSVYGGLSAIEARVGQEVGAGEMLGQLAPGAELYLELRRGQETLPPATWFGL